MLCLHVHVCVYVFMCVTIDFCYTICGRLNDELKDVHNLITGTCEHTILHAKKIFVGVIKLKIMRWGD